MQKVAPKSQTLLKQGILLISACAALGLAACGAGDRTKVNKVKKETAKPLSQEKVQNYQKMLETLGDPTKLHPNEIAERLNGMMDGSKYSSEKVHSDSVDTVKEIGASPPSVSLKSGTLSFSFDSKGGSGRSEKDWLSLNGKKIGDQFKEIGRLQESKQKTKQDKNGNLKKGNTQKSASNWRAFAKCFADCSEAFLLIADGTRHFPLYLVDHRKDLQSDDSIKLRLEEVLSSKVENILKKDEKRIGIIEAPKSYSLKYVAIPMGTNSWAQLKVKGEKGSLDTSLLGVSDLSNSGKASLCLNSEGGACSD